MSNAWAELITSPLVKAMLDEGGRLGVPDRKQERRMIVAAQKGDRAVREELMIRNSPFVVCEVKKMGSWGVDYVDLFQEGMIGLGVAIDRFDTKAYKNKFISYARWWVRQGMMLAAQHASGAMRVPVNRHLSVVKVRRMINSGQTVTPADVRRIFRVTLPVARAILDAANIPMSLNQASILGDDDRDEIGDMIAAPFNDDVADEDEVQWARKMIESDYKMTPKQKHVVFARLFDGRTLEDISTDFGVSRERIRQIEIEAMSRVRKLAAQYDERCGFTRGDRRSMLTIGGNA